MATIYVILGETTNRLKFGKTQARSALRRLEQLQVNSPDRLILLAESPGRPGKHEKYLHNYFAGFRLHGEWFSEEITPGVRKALDVEGLDKWLNSIVSKYELVGK